MIQLERPGIKQLRLLFASFSQSISLFLFFLFQSLQFLYQRLFPPCRQQLFTLFDITQNKVPKEEAAVINTIAAEYIEGFLAKPHPDLGRKGPVCPFVPKSMRLNSLYFCVMRTENDFNSEEIEKFMLNLKEKFEELEPKNSLYKAVSFFFFFVSSKK